MCQNELRTKIKHLNTSIKRIEAHIILLTKTDQASIKLLNCEKPLADSEAQLLPKFKKDRDRLQEELGKLTAGDVSALYDDEIVEYELSLGNVETVLGPDLGLSLPDTTLTSPRTEFRS